MLSFDCHNLLRTIAVIKIQNTPLIFRLKIKLALIRQSSFLSPTANFFSHIFSCFVSNHFSSFFVALPVCEKVLIYCYFNSKPIFDVKLNFTFDVTLNVTFDDTFDITLNVTFDTIIQSKNAKVWVKQLGGSLQKRRTNEITFNICQIRIFQCLHEKLQNFFWLCIFLKRLLPKFSSFKSKQRLDEKNDDWLFGLLSQSMEFFIPLISIRSHSLFILIFFPLFLIYIFFFFLWAHIIVILSLVSTYFLSLSFTSLIIHSAVFFLLRYLIFSLSVYLFLSLVFFCIRCVLKICLLSWLWCL